MGFWDTYDAVQRVDLATKQMLRAAGAYDGFRNAPHAQYGNILEVPGVLLPGDVRAKADLLNAKFDSMVVLVANPQHPLSAGFLAGWAQLLIRWKAAYVSITSAAAWLGQLWSARSADDQLNQFATEYNAAVAQYQAETGQSLPGAVAPTAPPPSDVAGKVEKVIYVAAALATIVSVGFLINAAKK